MKAPYLSFTKVTAFIAAVAALLSPPNSGSTYLDTAESQSRMVRLELRQRDREDHAYESTIELDSLKTAIVVVDMWTSHYCPGATAVAEALVPGMNKTLDAARKLGIQVIFASSGDDLRRWEGKPQRLRITGLPNHPLPKSNGFMNGAGIFGPYSAPCMCKVTEIKTSTHEPLFHCNKIPSNFNQNPNLVVGDSDVFVAAGHYRPGVKLAIDSWGEPSQQELWNFAHTKGITTLLYVGVNTNMCVINREFAMIQMRRLGLKTIIVRDMTRAMTYNGYNPITKVLDPRWTPEVGTRYAIEYIEKNIGPSINSHQILFAASAIEGAAHR